MQTKISKLDTAAMAQELVDAVERILGVFKGEDSGPDLAGLLDDMAHYAWSGHLWEEGGRNWLEERLTEICTPMELLAGNFMPPSGERLVSADTRAGIELISAAANARWKIDEGMPVWIEELAALANVSERTIRAATNASNPNAIPITKDGHRTLIKARDALAWLSRRSDFVPTADGSLAPDASAFHGSKTVGEIWRSWREKRGLTVDDLAVELEWAPQQAATYAQIESNSPDADLLALPPAFWSRLGRHFGAGQPDDVAAKTFRRLAGDYATRRISSDLQPAA